MINFTYLNLYLHMFHFNLFKFLFTYASFLRYFSSFNLFVFLNIHTATFIFFLAEPI